MKPLRVVIIDDHWVVRKGIKSSLEDDDSFVIVGESSNGEEGMALIRNVQPNLALVDVRLPDISGAKICQQVTEEGLPTAVVILTAFLDWRLVQTCIYWGARGYLLKDAERLNLKQKLLAVSQGEIVLDPKVVSLLANYVREHPDPENREVLNAREMEILQLMSQGFSNKEIGEKIHFSQGTVKDYVHNILLKLNARNRVEAILIATKSGLL